MNLAEITLLRPEWLLALVPAGLLLWRLARRADSRTGPWSRLVDPHLLPHVVAEAPARGRRLGLTLLAAALASAIVALAGPGLAPPAGRPDLTRILVVDLSPAMAGKTSGAALEEARLKLVDLLRSLPAGQTALLVYADEPYLVVPPSTDVETIIRFVPELAPDAMPVAGSRPDRALEMAGEVLARSGSQHREILWVVAGPGPGPLPAALPERVRLSILQAAGEDDPQLKALAARQGGIYQRIQPDDADIRRLAAAGAGERDAGARGQPQAEAGYWLVLPLLPLAALAFRRGLLGLALGPLLLAGLLAPEPAAARDGSILDRFSDYRAWRRLEAGDAAGAARRFSDPRWRAAASYRAGRFDEAAALLEAEGDADSLYNRGNALARQGRLLEALASFDASLKLREDADARHNRDLVERLLKEGRSGGTPPPPAEGEGRGTPPRGRASNAEEEAERLAGRWLRQVPDEPGSLLRQKLLAEHRRRAAREGGSP